jgi:hypothetical protein
MAAGDAFIAVQPKVEDRGINWKKWLRENCFIGSARTAQFYQQLARHRDQIEREIEDAGELSLRAARRLISSPRNNSGGGAGRVGEAEIPAEPETLIEHWRRRPGELTALLDAVGVAKVLEAMSEEFGRQLRDRLPAPKRKKSDKPYTKTITLRAERETGFRH